MPDRPYFPRRNPPDLWDRIGYHYMELVIAFYSMTYGVLRLIDSFAANVQLTTRSVPHLPASVISIVLVVGGAVWSLAIVRRFETVNSYYFTLRTGLSLLSIAWGSYFVVAIMLKPQIISVWLFALSLLVATGGLYLQSFHNEKAARRR